mgnify:CR=1 FL=1
MKLMASIIMYTYSFIYELSMSGQVVKYATYVAVNSEQ